MQTDLALSFARGVENNMNERGLGFRVPRHAEHWKIPIYSRGQGLIDSRVLAGSLYCIRFWFFSCPPRLSKYSLKCQCPLEQWTREEEAERALTKQCRKSIKTMKVPIQFDVISILLLLQC